MIPSVSISNNILNLSIVSGEMSSYNHSTGLCHFCITLTNLANLYVECFDFKQAYEYAHLVLNLRIKLWGQDSPKLARSYYLLGITLLYLDRIQSKDILTKAKKLALEINDTRLVSAIEIIIQSID